ncbi:tetratricopeptide repeat protein [Streptomyces sp. NBC_01764]|uniref:tetratricopeptide repeat protein n=1 Tax=Streptomyces sp. NBC_01764 TaxID=2975935 RepID=UPI0022562AC4|nr:tetratricopeptide repeat protein [Streptomyces sp. NBC_01764]MCX4404494.1 tetratricopeptide repeat protein [Streptomyces sp. NBC_01764]
MIPHRALSFQHRAEADQLRAAVDAGGTAVLSQVLTGTGGTGKTQLAADYARTAWEGGTVDVLVWISASSRQTIMDGYAQAGIEVLAADPSDPQQAAQFFLAWQEPKRGQKPCRWLVVLDNLADPADLWPPSQHGCTLVTTRRREAALTGEGRRLVHVGMFEPSEAAAYLTAVLTAHGRHEPLREINALAADLGYLPLALAQAAAYLIDAAITCADYRRWLADRIKKLARLLPEPSALPDDQAVTVAATWSLSIERADKLQPAGLARPMLQLAAMLDPNGIPQTVLTSEPARAHLAAHRAASQREPALVTAEEAAGALRVLHQLTLIDHTPDNPHQAARVHQLVQRATRDTLTSHQRDQLALTATDALIAAWPDIELDTALAQALRANTAALVSHAEDALFQDGAGLNVLFRSGSSLGDSGQATAAIKHYEHMATIAHDRLGADDIYTLSARAGLAYWRGEAGDAAGAAAAFEQLLADELRLLGPNHHPFMTRANLATYRGRAGDAAGAVAAFEQLLADRERVFGPDHPNTFPTRSDVGNWRGKAGDAAGAAAAHEQLLADELRLLSPDHPWTLITRHDLAFWRGEAGDAAGAAVAFEQLQADQERVFGPDHPKTLTTRHNRAQYQGEAGDAAGAAAAYAELVADTLRVLGPDHPSTLVTRAHLGEWLPKTGDAASAAAVFEQLLPAWERVFGPDHPDTLGIRANLALQRVKASDYAGAATAYEQLLPAQERVYGPDHAQVLTTRAAIAGFRREAGDTSGAVTAFEELLTAQERVLGPVDAHTLLTQNNLTAAYMQAGHTSKALTLLEDLVPRRSASLGPDHPDTLASRAWLAGLLTERGLGRLPREPSAAWRDAATAVSLVGPHLGAAPELLVPRLRAAYLLAAVTLEVDGQTEAARDYRQRAGQLDACHE